MKKVRNRLLFAGWMLAMAGMAVAEPVDPRFPSEQVVVVAPERSWWLPSRIRQIEMERDQLLEKISVLPQHDPKFQSDHLGYHSLIEDPALAGSLPPHQIDIKLAWVPVLGSIALAPAFNPMESMGVYAFPKRFKIEVLNEKTDEFETVVNWMNEDFPDPGPYPVFFSGINRATKQVRITVPQEVGKSGGAYFALGEIYLLRRKSNDQMGDNMCVWIDTEIEASDSLVMPPEWDVQYLRDGVDGFGFPLSDETVASEDLLIRSENGEQLSEKVQLTLDLGRVRDIGPIDFWPATAPHRLALSAFGFPEKISVELSTDPDFNKAGVFGVKNAIGNRQRGHLFSVKCAGCDARYIRITLKELREYKGKRILGLGEILVSHNEEIWSRNGSVTSKGIPDEYLDQLPRLVDGYSRQRRILPQGEWIKGLAQRRPLDRRLAVVERELALARETWRVLQLRISIWGSVILCMALIFGRVFMKRQRHRVLNKLKLRITRDLHDEVGSSLGSISLTAEQLEQMTSDAEMKEELDDLSLMAREACVSLREVVWMIDQSTIYLPDLIKKMVERAERVLHDINLSVEMPPDCPNTEVALLFKRYFIMFFKEAVHNCVRHAHATRVWVEFSTEDQHLRVSVRDNGCGFDPEEASNGCGLDNMKERAKEMGGRSEIVSQPGKGTSIVLSVPLANLSKEPSNAYTTSN